MTGPSLPLWEAVLRLLLVVGLAGVVGAERELRDQDAGLRTHMLVGLGAALFVITGNYAWYELRFGNEAGIVLDPSRVVAYVVTGIGFLGAGAIIKNGATVRGLTTAASLWVVAAVGVGIGSGEYWLGAIATAIIILSLWPVRRLAAAAGLRRTGSHTIAVDLAPDADPAAIIDAAEAAAVQVHSISIDVDGDARRVVLSISAAPPVAQALFQQLAGMPAIRRTRLER